MESAKPTFLCCGTLAIQEGGLDDAKLAGLFVMMRVYISPAGKLPAG